MSARQVCFGSRYLSCRECPGCRFLTQRNACVNSGMCVAAEGMERHMERHMVRYYAHEAVFLLAEIAYQSDPKYCFFFVIKMASD